jgi:MFS family permease
VVAVWHLVALSLLQGVLTAFDQTVRRSLLFDMVDGDKADLASAIGLNSTLQMAARTVGPAAGGLLMAAVGGAICFVLNGVSYLPIIVLLAMMRVREARGQSAEATRERGLRDGLKYVLAVKPIRDSLVLLALGSLCGVPFAVLLPMFSQEIFGGGPQVLGFLVAASGAGSLIGAAYVAGHGSGGGSQRLAPIGAGFFGLGLVGFASTAGLLPAMMFLAVAGFGMMLLITGTNVLIQTLARDEQRGRVMSWYTVAFNGTVPFGSLAAGWLANEIGIASTLLVGGGICLVAAVSIGLRLLQLSPRQREAYAPS